ncbi:MAG: CBS domain-containing protein [Gemmatimonadaceae bacterium]
MKAQEIMVRNPGVVTPETGITAAARLMKSEDVGVLPVVEREGSTKLVGVITDRDIAIRHVAEGHTSADCPVSEAMSAGIHTCKPDDDVRDVMKVMGSEQIRRIPVVDERGALVGIIAQADVVRKADSDSRSEEMVEKISAPGGKHAH